MITWILLLLDMWIKDGGNNRTNWSSEEFEKLLEKQKEQQDRKNGMESLKKLKTFLDERPIYPFTGTLEII